jgi:hypothetical protein
LTEEEGKTTLTMIVAPVSPTDEEKQKKWLRRDIPEPMYN